jgi:hypothetical protein
VNTHLAADWRARRMGSASAEGWTLKQVQGDGIWWARKLDAPRALNVRADLRGGWSGYAPPLAASWFSRGMIGATS